MPVPVKEESKIYSFRLRRDTGDHRKQICHADRFVRISGETRYSYQHCSCYALKTVPLLFFGTLL